MKLDYRGEEFIFEDTPTLSGLVNEIFNDNYKLFARRFHLQEGDVVLDIGANEGLFSIMLAKLFHVRVIALEPVPRTFDQMLKNIELNKVNVEAVNLGVGKGSFMNVHKTYSGGSSLVDTFDKENHDKVLVTLFPIDRLWDRFSLNRVKLMKIDIEGGEYEALYNCSNLSLVDNIVGEFHINKKLESLGYDINELATWVGSKTNLIYYDRCKMNE